MLRETQIAALLPDVRPVGMAERVRRDLAAENRHDLVADLVIDRLRVEWLAMVPMGPLHMQKQPWRVRADAPAARGRDPAVEDPGQLRRDRHAPILVPFAGPDIERPALQ